MPLNKDQSYLRWAGGKRRLVVRLKKFVPADLNSRTYREPFLGAASLYLSLTPQPAILSDINRDLINSFLYVRDQPTLVSRYLARHAAKNSREYYYRTRDRYNASRKFSCAQAARFIYLNRTCFNGIFRVNLKGGFNVPYGNLTNPLFPDRQHLLSVSEALRCTHIRSEPYQDALRRAKQDDFVYLDPPYPPLNGTSFFRHYTTSRFPQADQEELAYLVKRLDRRGSLVMISNADTDSIHSLYKGFVITSLPVRRWISSKNVKHLVNELVITNYDVKP